MSYIAMASPVLPMSIGFYRWKLLNKPLRYFTFFLLLTVIQVDVEYFLGKQHMSTHLLSDYFQSIEVLFYLFLFRQHLMPEIKNKVIITFSSLYLILWIIVSLFFYVPDQFNTIIDVAALVILIFSSMLVIYSIANKYGDILIPLQRNYIFWIAIGVLIYCSGSFMVISLGNDLMKLGLGYITSMWYINWSFFILANLLFSYSISIFTE